MMLSCRCVAHAAFRASKMTGAWSRPMSNSIIVTVNNNYFPSTNHNYLSFTGRNFSAAGAKAEVIHFLSKHHDSAFFSWDLLCIFFLFYHFPLYLFLFVSHSWILKKSLSAF